MIDFEGYYSFAPEQVECIETADNRGGTHPYELSVCLKSGKKLSVSYQTKKIRDAVHRTLISQINYELRRDAEHFQICLLRVEDTVKRMDKRQIRIWKQLKALLSLNDGDEGEI